MKDFELLLLDGTNPSGVSMSRDILAAAALLAARTGEPVPSWGMYSPTGGHVRLQGGIGADTARLPPRRRAQHSILLVPGLWVADARELRARIGDDDCALAIRHIAAHVAGGGQVAASCSAVFLLQAAGVLAGRHATTAWWLAPELARGAADVCVEANRILCVDGPILTAGAAFAQSDLVLHLLRARFGARLADGVSRVLLLHERGQQAQFVVPAMLASGDALVARLTRRVETALPEVPSVAELARELCVSERTLGRRVRHATGMGTNSLIRSIRLHRARGLLQHSRISIERIAVAVGYQDATALRRLLRKAVGTTPGGMRATMAVAAPRETRRRGARND
jgi:transcriptional regulator GlxA family with amidase domain